VLLDDVVEAASELDAGGFGRFLKEIRYGRSEVELTRGPAEDAAAIEFTTAAEELLDRAAQCAEACGHAVIGTPHVLTAALQDYAPLRSAVAAQGVDPAEVLDRTLQALGAPNAEETFAGTPQPRAMPPSPNCGLALSRAQKRSESLSPLTVADLLIAILTQTTSKAAVVLQALGVETYDLVRRIDSTP
jgi:ATP-dependent Clp protease ATP-binding subunit ClpA